MRNHTRRNRLVNYRYDVDLPLSAARLNREFMGSMLYFIRVEHCVKIGYSASLVTRLRGYGPHWAARLMHVEAGSLEDEQALHRRFAPFRAYGNEYYAPVPHLLRYINERRVEVHGIEPIDWRTFGQPKAS